MKRLFRTVVGGTFMLFSSLCSAQSTITISDGCSRLVGTAAGVAGSSPISVDGSTGNVTVSGFAASLDANNNIGYVAGPGVCDTLAPGAAPQCTISASSTRAAAGTPVTLYARCPGKPDSYTWGGPTTPALPSNASTLSSITLSFTQSGIYTYSVAATASGVAGSRSEPVSILVGGSSDRPNCVLSSSQPTILALGSATLSTVCWPDATSFTWASDPSGPQVPNGSGGSVSLSFPTAGAYTYKVVGSNSVGSGNQWSATVNVLAAQPTCNAPTAPTASGPTTTNTSVQGSIAAAGTEAFSFTLLAASTPLTLRITPGTTGTSATFTYIALGQRGQFDVAPQCTASGNYSTGSVSIQVISSNLAATYPNACPIPASPYLNVRNVNSLCDSTSTCPGNGTCTFTLSRF